MPIKLAHLARAATPSEQLVAVTMAALEELPSAMACRRIALVQTATEPIG
ncbi:MAG TPA: hypothetical protein VIJ15_15935 [Dermatophilaceae bacterium]